VITPPNNTHASAKVPRYPRGLSLTELVAAAAILGVLALVIVPRIARHHDDAERTACHTNRTEIELQARLWRRSTGSYPAANLGDIGGNAAYFPAGLPICPVDGSAYTIDTTGGIVIGHTH
jgi:prepilin-type N-terminal cleavage/methylation domain-containing protein